MTTVNRGLWLLTALAVVQDKAQLARVLGMVPASDKAGDLSPRKWIGTPIREDEHREIADAQMRAVLPRILDGRVWNLTRAIDAFLTALAHYSVAAGATFELSDPLSTDAPDVEARTGGVAVEMLSGYVVEMLDVLDDVLAAIAVGDPVVTADGLAYRPLVRSSTLAEWTETRGRIVRELRLERPAPALPGGE
jgi:hypothetical protein